jgi:hypothetical protein
VAEAILLSDEEFELGDTGLGGDLHYIVVRAENAQDAYDTARAQSVADGAETYFGIPAGHVGGKHIGGGVWEVNVSYSPRARTDAGAAAGNTPAGSGGSGSAGGQDPEELTSREWTLTTGGGTRHITRSLSVRYQASNGGNPAPNDGNLIGHDESGVAGLDIEDPVAVIRWTDKVPRVTIGYFVKMCRLTAKTNHQAWKGFDYSELLCSGIDLHYKDGNGWDRSVTLKYRQNQGDDDIDITEPGTSEADRLWIPAGVKKGWDYIDVRYTKKVDGGFEVQVPTRVYVHQVYDAEDFNDFQL